LAGSGALTKSGTGTNTLSGSNTFTGSTIITSGALNIQNNSALGGTGAGTTVNDGAALQLQGGITVTGEALSLSGVGVNSDGALRNISGTNTYAGVITLSSTITNRVFIFSDAGLLTLNTGTITGSGISLRTGGIGDMAISSVIGTGTGGLTKGGVGTLTLSGANTYSGGTTVNNGTLTLSGLGTLGATNGALTIIGAGRVDLGGLTRTNGAFTLDSGTLSNGTFTATSFALTNAGTVSAVLAGSGAVTKTGAGTATLSGANTYTGGTLISGGALQIGNGGTTGSLAGAITNNASLIFNRSDNLTQSNAITGTGNLTKTGAGTLTLLSGASYSGGTLVSAGGLQGSTASLQGIITNNGTVIFDQDTNGSYADVLSGSGSVNKAGSGTVTFTSDNSYTGETWIQLGTLNLNAAAGAAKNTTSARVSTNATLLISQSNQVNNIATTVTLSGGTIRTAAGVTETFGNLTLSSASFLDFGATFGNASSMSFGTYTPSALLTINNFDYGSTLTFGSDLTSTINNSSFFTFNNGGIASSSWNGTTFTITAIPEPSTYLAAAGLLALILWPSRRRLLKDAKSILGLRAPMRDRLAGKA
jgi:autotransporter-associated beta strand protein